MTIDSDLTSNRNPRTCVSPTPFEIASIAAQLSNGKDPEKHLIPAYNLYWATFREAKTEQESRFETALAINKLENQIYGGDIRHDEFEDLGLLRRTEVLLSEIERLEGLLKETLE